MTKKQKQPKRYWSAQSNDTKRSESVERQQQYERLAGRQRCGGGYRIHRKRVGGDNY